MQRELLEFLESSFCDQKLINFSDVDTKKCSKFAFHYAAYHGVLYEPEMSDGRITLEFEQLEENLRELCGMSYLLIRCDFDYLPAIIDDKLLILNDHSLEHDYGYVVHYVHKEPSEYEYSAIITYIDRGDEPVTYYIDGSEVSYTELFSAADNVNTDDKYLALEKHILNHPFDFERIKFTYRYMNGKIYYRYVEYLQPTRCEI
ncbi:MAG: hypothetical protein HFE63_04595 [Clostridiales bacterium]|nr:hypothetical protein [Clostridiales bacterium]